jgi:hypothetical protein
MLHVATATSAPASAPAPASAVVPVSAIKPSSVANGNSVDSSNAVKVVSAGISGDDAIRAKSPALMLNAKLNPSASSMECYAITTQVGGDAFVCALKPPATAWIGNVVAVIALLISIGGFYYSLQKDRKARLQSIEDDFWLRKVISPIALEPLIKKITETVSSIPEDRQSARFDSQACDEFGKKFQSEWNQLSCAMDALGLLNQDVLDNSRTHVSNIEDEVLLYCSNNIAGGLGASGGCINKSQLQENINLEMIKIMNCIKQYQLSKI